METALNVIQQKCIAETTTLGKLEKVWFVSMLQTKTQVSTSGWEPLLVAVVGK